MSEELLATAMHALEQSNPARALEMARQGLRQWPQSERAPEFARTEVKCLYALGKPSEGRGAAEAMVNKYVGTPWALEVERETGAHPHVNH
jgi:TolA-binding protein